ncbi:hypothetical protein ACFFX0_07300 [Citricoccus parietis]|uniref:Uncharacterized protein n=1 Tax=Citricoccus parietis TaxID=592307 RepID=A0ABV5FWD9_9MICC
MTTAISRMRERKSTVRCAKRWTGCLNSGSTMGIGGGLLGWMRPADHVPACRHSGRNRRHRDSDRQRSWGRLRGRVHHHRLLQRPRRDDLLRVRAATDADLQPAGVPPRHPQPGPGTGSGRQNRQGRAARAGLPPPHHDQRRRPGRRREPTDPATWRPDRRRGTLGPGRRIHVCQRAGGSRGTHPPGGPEHLGGGIREPGGRGDPDPRRLVHRHRCGHRPGDRCGRRLNRPGGRHRRRSCRGTRRRYTRGHRSGGQRCPGLDQ